MSTKLFNAAAAAAANLADPASEEGAIEAIAVPSGNDEENAAVSNDAESTISSSSSNAAEDAGQQRTVYVKCGGSLVMAAAALGALAVIGAGSVHLAGRPTMNFSSSKQVAVSSGDIKIKGFTFVGDGLCYDYDGIAGLGNDYDYVRYRDVASAKECAKKCSKCPGGGQKGDINGEKLVLRGFEFVFDSRQGGDFCYCLVEDGAEFTTSVCAGAVTADDENEGTGEIEGSTNDAGLECWKVNSKTSKSSKSGSSKGGKRG